MQGNSSHPELNYRLQNHFIMPRTPPLAPHTRVKASHTPRPALLRMFHTQNSVFALHEPRRATQKIISVSPGASTNSLPEQRRQTKR